ncbi:hypothetical protein CYMTET_52928 [Cymbomonas tetramitiformis]|uniref:Pectate lyase C n=1 Tax=Cymbomonas tetramitiformis TaxID=36881 RepID=A0AAE0BI07_9CHLO|nr:hypothetical protein CYMTET_52928 [Cymbomonas tetramitiformis]
MNALTIMALVCALVCEPNLVTSFGDEGFRLLPRFSDADVDKSGCISPNEYAALAQDVRQRAARASVTLQSEGHPRQAQQQVPPGVVSLGTFSLLNSSPPSQFQLPGSRRNTAVLRRSLDQPQREVQENGSETVIDDTKYSYLLLNHSLQNASINIVHLRSHVSLEAALPTILHTVAIFGDCVSLGVDDGRCRISGGLRFRLFSLGEAAVVHLQALELRDGYTSSDGAAVHGIDAFISLHDCVLAQNVASSSSGSGGGALYFLRGDVVCSNCTVVENEGPAYGAMLVVEGGLALEAGTVVEGNIASDHCGGVGVRDGVLILNGSSTVSGNRARTAGGGICGSQGAEVWIDGGSEVVGNFAAAGGGLNLFSYLLVENETMDALNIFHEIASGGAVTAAHELNRLTLTGNSSVHGNYAESQGGGIMMQSRGHIVLTTGTRISGNLAADGGGIYLVQAVEVLVEAAALCSNVGLYSGGAVYANHAQASIRLDGSLVCNNSAQSGSGGGIYATGQVELSSGAHVERNIASVDGGGLFIGPHALVSISASAVMNNSAGGRGGGIYAEGAETKGGSQVVVMDSSRIEHNEGFIEGGGMSIGPNATLMMYGISVSHNRLISTGDGVGAGFSIGMGTTARVVLSTIANNFISETFGAGGGLGVDGLMVLTNVNVSWNMAALGGGILVGKNGTVWLEGCVVEWNTAQSGGGIFGQLGGRIQIDLSRLRGNLAETSGGGVFCHNLTLSGSFLSLNSAFRNGGGVSGKQLIRIFNTSFSLGTAQNGGAVHLDMLDLGDSHFHATGCLMTRNSATNGGGSVSLRGALSPDLAALEDSLISHSTSNVGGGVYAMQGALTLSGVVLENNQAINGGAVAALPNTTLLITGGSVARGNAAESHGGGIYILDRSQLTVTGGSLIEDNKCYMSGGGIHLTRSSHALITGGVQVRNNLAEREGGGIAVLRSVIYALQVPTRLTVMGAAVTGNMAVSYSGGGILSDERCVVTLVATNISANQAGFFGGGIAAKSSVQIYGHSILA